VRRTCCNNDFILVRSEVFLIVYQIYITGKSVIVRNYKTDQTQRLLCLLTFLRKYSRLSVSLRCIVAESRQPKAGGHIEQANCSRNKQKYVDK